MGNHVAIPDPAYDTCTLPDAPGVSRTFLPNDDEDMTNEYSTVLKKVGKPIRDKIYSVARIDNNELDRRLTASKNREMPETDNRSTLLSFYTTKQNAEAIIQNGFTVDQYSKGPFGHGIYFVSNDYKINEIKACNNGRRCQLVCEVALGKPKVCDTPNRSLDSAKLKAMGCDSVLSGQNKKKQSANAIDRDDEYTYVVYRAEQVSPRYLVTFRSSRSTGVMLDKAVQCEGVATSLPGLITLIVDLVLDIMRSFRKRKKTKRS
ncbi:hypothetical protein BOX15_Mlig006965g3 [Macrostomum lignano]|uniref:PARP catalytic domain-containing protein n=1 Tax=Macrostomum lignano TaxID=282301 RepID=A0A267G124_9PLAT|nr:hypothetical protein BOX15_Mlig006965g3 [Macrostomum lignano]